MKSKIVIALLVGLNLYLLVIVESGNDDDAVIKKTKAQIENANYYTSLVLNNVNHFSGLELPDSLKEKFMLYIPEQGCGTCIDSAVVLLSKFEKEQPKFDFFIATPFNNLYLKKFIRYNNIDAPIVENQQFFHYSEGLRYPLLTYSSKNSNFVFVIPVSKDYLESFKYLMKNIIKNLP